MRSVSPIIWVAPAMLLLVATFHLPYGYYTFTRIVACSAACFLAILVIRERRSVNSWAALLIAMAILFNPLIPIHFSRATWFYLDIIAAVAFLAHLVFVRRQVA